MYTPIANPDKVVKVIGKRRRARARGKYGVKMTPALRKALNKKWAADKKLTPLQREMQSRWSTRPEKSFDERWAIAKELPKFLQNAQPLLGFSGERITPTTSKQDKKLIRSGRE